MARAAENASAYNLARCKANTPPEEWRRILALNNAARSRNPNKAIWYKRADLKRYYNLTIEEWNVMFDRQGRLCAVCRSPHSGRKNGQWCTDHDHKTGSVRGILCNGCNMALGQIKDDPQRLRMLAEYVETGGACHARSEN